MEFKRVLNDAHFLTSDVFFESHPLGHLLRAGRSFPTKKLLQNAKGPRGLGGGRKRQWNAGY